MNGDDWQLLFAGTEWDNLKDISQWFCDAYEDFPKWEAEIKDLIEQAYKMGYDAGYKAAQIKRKPTLSNLVVLHEYGTMDKEENARKGLK